VAPEEIKAIRTEAGLTQVQFSREIGADAITVSRWERGVQQALPVYIGIIRQKFGRPIPAKKGKR